MTKVLFIAIFVSLALVNALDQLDLEDTENDVQPSLLDKRQTVCKDKNTRCGYFKRYYCQSPVQSTRKWMEENCRRACGLCGATKPRPTRRPTRPPTNCKDKDDRCRRYKNYCRGNSNWMEVNCHRTCGRCGTTKPRPTRRPVRLRTRPTQKPKCYDKNEMCGGWQNLCSINEWVQENCRLTCGCGTIKPRPTRRPTRPPKKGVQQVEVNIRECLAAHNEKRRKHGAAPLTWDSKLAQDAQKWALYLASIKRMKHAQGTGQGENLAYSYSSWGSGYTCKQATQAWYDEVEYYPFSNPPRSMQQATGHFTQVVWKSTQLLGVGIARNGNYFYVVARYSKPGNVYGQFEQNVGNPRGRG